ncbi:gas vesicle protein [Streptomyces sp. Isolate_219]|uniref:gas vesicle protein GvpO n=1 Tax=Streptomyces sp. Isolate_219 TaxID=2950110 RepID=UPI0021C7C233|nr:gas vesicle protein [Streptomyces sp. Isolate_219]MCR8573779.1 gas vesicle protein [Streptomyces sp. Isolate_219]
MATEENTEREKAHGGGTERISASTAMRHASGQLAQLLQCEPDSVSALKPTEDGWLANVEVVEIERVPDTASVMASYRVHLDEQGQLMGYERTRRYGRGQIDR